MLLSVGFKKGNNTQSSSFFNITTKLVKNKKTNDYPSNYIHALFMTPLAQQCCDVIEWPQ